MNLKKIYLLRHGQTDYNLQGVVQGSGIDAPINDTGWAQADAFFCTYRDIPFDQLYHSALIRTQQSIQGFIDLGIPVTSLSELNEISWGIREGRSPSNEDDAYYRNLVRTWRTGDVHIPSEEGESPIDVLERQKPVVELILSRREEKSILIAMHGRAMRVLLTHLFNQPLQNMDHFAHQNLCLYHLQYDYEKGIFISLKANHADHLQTLPDSI